MLNLKNQPSNKTTKNKSGKSAGKVTSYAKDPQETTRPAKSLNKKQPSASTTKQQTTSSHSTSTKASIPISDVTGSRGLVSQPSKPAGNGNTNGSKRIPISDITGNRGLFSQKPIQTEKKDESKGTTPTKAPHIPISVVTGSRDITTVSPELRSYLQKDSPSATNAIPKEYADLANVLEKMGSGIDLSNWARMTTKQQLALAQKIGLSDQDQQTLLNTAPHYIETIRKIQDVFANRYDLGITLNDARNVAIDLFEIANERNEAISRTGRYENDAVFAPKALRWLDEKEEKILKNLQENTNEVGQATWYNGGNSEPEEDKETSADIHRRAKYADIDVAAASKQIEELILKNVEEAKKLAGLSYVYGNAPGAYTKQAKWFMNNVTKNKPMDYKNPAIWFKSFPDLPYPKEDKVYDVFGFKVSSSDLGNLNYALVGKALGLPETLLLQQAGAAQLKDHMHYTSIGAQFESIKRRERGYGDQPDDQEMIKIGFAVYDLLD